MDDQRQRQPRQPGVPGDAGMIDAVLKAERDAEARVAAARDEAAARREAARAEARAIEARASSRLAAVRQRFEAALSERCAEFGRRAGRETAAAETEAYGTDELAAAADAVAARLTGGGDDPPR